MSWNERVRQTHRWVSVVFTAAVVVNLVALGAAKPPAWIGLTALLPLAVLQVTGLYLLVAPSMAKRRGREG